MRKDVISCLKEGLDMLTPRQRIAVELRYLEKRKYREIAEAIGDHDRKTWRRGSKNPSLERVRQITLRGIGRLRAYHAPKLREIIS